MVLKRVTYAERQPISLDSLVDEQAYQTATRRRHYLAHHDWGIVEGLELRTAGDGFVLQHGLAIDGFGRELIVPSEIVVDATVLAQLNANNIAAWLVYSRRDENTSQSGVYSCGPGKQDRTLEQALLRLEAVDAIDTIDGRNPSAVSVTDLAFGAQDDLVDDAAAVWPVFLGGLSRPSLASPYTIVTAGRPFALLRGELISAASGTAQVQVGAEASGDHRRFAVMLPDSVGENGAERLSIDLEGGSKLIGNTKVFGDLAIEPAPPVNSPAGYDLCAGLESLRERFWGVEFFPVAPPKTATPWTIRHALVPPPQEAVPQSPTDQLRFEYFDPGTKGDPTVYKCSIGVKKQGKFFPCVSVDAECNLTVHGHLILNKSLVWGPVKPDPADPRFQAEVLKNWVQGLVSNTSGLAQYYGANMAMSLVGLADSSARVDIPCTLYIENTGSLALELVKVTETFSISGTTATPAPPSGISLSPGETKQFSRTYNVPTAGSLDVSVHAQGIAKPNGYLIETDLKQTVVITDSSLG